MTRNPSSPTEPDTEDPYNVFLHEYFESNTEDRIDLLSCTRDISGLLFFADDHVSTLSNIQIERITRSKKEIQGTTGDLSDYYVFKIPILSAVSNFSSWIHMEDEVDELPEIVDNGHPVKKVISKTKDKKVKESLKKDFLPLPASDDVDAYPFHLPVAIPLFYHHVFDGPPNQDGLFESLHSANPVLSLWLSTIINCRFLTPGYHSHPNWHFISPAGFSNTTVDNNTLPVTLVRSGPIKCFFDDLLSKKGEDNKDEENISVVSNKPRGQKRKHLTSDDESDAGDDQKYQAFLQMLEVLLPIPLLDAQDQIIELIPPTFTDDLVEFTKTATSTRALSRQLLNAIQARINGPEGKSRDYLYQSVELPILGQATMTYLINSMFATPRNATIDAFKNTFNIFSLLPPSYNKAYDDHVYTCNKNNADDILEQADHNMSAVKRTPFINGRQEKLSDVLATIGNVFLFFRCFIEFDIQNEKTYPLFLRRLADLASTVNDYRFRQLVDSSISQAPWIPHQIIYFIQSYFQTLTLNATNPALLRNIQTEVDQEKYNVRDYKQSEYLFTSFHDNLLHSMNCNTLGLLTSPPQTFYSFFPSARRKNEHHDDRRDRDPARPPPQPMAQLIVKGTGPVVPPHAKMSCRPCSGYMQGKCLKPSSGPNKCAYAHILFPRDYTTEDRAIMKKWVEDDPRLSWARGPKEALEKIKV